MRARRSLSDLALVYAEMDRRDPRGIHEVLSPSAAGILLFRTSDIACLTHVTRYVTHSTATYRDFVLVAATAECGISGNYGWNHRRRMLVIDPADETFGCHACLAICERLGLPTYSLIPDTGCSATGGARFRPAVRHKLPPPRGPILVPTADHDKFLAVCDAIERFVNTLDNRSPEAHT